MEGTNPDGRPVLRRVATAFKDETGAELDVQYVPWAVGPRQVRHVDRRRHHADVAEVGTTWTPRVRRRRRAGRPHRRGAARRASSDDLVPGLAEAGTVDGALYGMPWYAGVRSVVYRTDVFEKAGVEPPTTWDELVAAGEKIKAAEPDMIPFPVAGDSEYGVYPFIWGAGGEIADPGRRRLDVARSTRPRPQEGIEFYTDLATRARLSTPAATTWDEADLSATRSPSGDVAMMIAGSWTPKAHPRGQPRPRGQDRRVPDPGPGRRAVARRSSAARTCRSSRTAENPDLAWALVRADEHRRVRRRSGASSPASSPAPDAAREVAARATRWWRRSPSRWPRPASVPVTPLYGQVQGKKTVPAMLQSILSGEASVDRGHRDRPPTEMDEIFSRGS